MNTKVILDTDTYNECDDQFALSYLIRSKDKLDIEAITIAPFSHEGKETVPEGQQLSYDEVLKLCKWLDYDCEGKVFMGSMDYMVNGYEEETPAVTKIIEIARKNEKTLILAIGAFTNVALALKKAPDIKEKIEVYWLGGHSFLQPVNNEYNFQQDIEANRFVFESGVKLTVLPCKNVISNLRVSFVEVAQRLESKGEFGRYLINRFDWDGYNHVGHRRVIWDISVIAYTLHPEWFTVREYSCPKINDDLSYTMTEGRHTVKFVCDLRVNNVLDEMFERITA